jgi:peptide-methionine (S)-S-oxide reductase
LGGVSGVIRTRVGYAGGESSDPTYHNLGGHTETVQVDFDPATISYRQLVELFFADHDPTVPGLPRQYRSVIFVQDAEQEQVAREVMQQVQASAKRPVQTAIEPLKAFNMAEDYHQKYALQGDSLIFGEFRAMYPDVKDLVDSTAAARVNAYLYGEGTAEQLQSEIDQLGLSAQALAHLRAASPTGACAITP